MPGAGAAAEQDQLADPRADGIDGDFIAGGGGGGEFAIGADPPHQQQLFADQGRRFLRGDNRARDSCQMHDLLLLNELNMPRLCRFARQRGHDAFAVDNQTPLAQLRDVAIAQH